jgi:hypothetical protein
VCDLAFIGLDKGMDIGHGQGQLACHRQADPETTLQGKFHLGIPYLGIARPQSQFPHSCVGEPFIYSQDQSTYFPAAE